MDSLDFLLVTSVELCRDIEIINFTHEDIIGNWQTSGSLIKRQLNHIRRHSRLSKGIQLHRTQLEKH